MAVFRIEKQKNYTVMSNVHLQDMNLSLKAKGLLSQMLSLPESWDYTLRGLAAINKESVNTIGGIVNELIEAGYIVRDQIRRGSGKFSGTEYVIFEAPKIQEAEEGRAGAEGPGTEMPVAKEEAESVKNTAVPPCHKKRDTVKRDTVFCDANKILNNKILNNINNNPSYQSKDLYDFAAARGPSEEQGNGYEEYRSLILENIDYKILVHDNPGDVPMIDGMVNIILDVILSKKGTIRIAKEEKPQSLVKAKFLKLKRQNILYVLYCLKENTTRIQDIVAYIRTALYNAPDTESVYWWNRVMNDQYGARDGPE